MRVVTELEIDDGRHRLDAVGVRRDRIHAWEIKSAADSVRRLVEQAAAMTRLADYRRIARLVNRRALKTAVRAELRNHPFRHAKKVGRQTSRA